LEFPSIADIPERIDIVDVFRISEDIPAVVDDVLKKKDGIKVFWMQLGNRSSIGFSILCISRFFYNIFICYSCIRGNV
jgi:predicted CoA-binding protein